MHYISNKYIYMNKLMEMRMLVMITQSNNYS